jgi:xylulokinase
VAVGLSGQTPGHVLVTADGTPLGRAIIWSDQRAGAEAAWLTKHLTAQQAREWTGSPSIADVTQPPARLLWLKKHRPNEWARCDAVVQPKDFIALRLTGQIATDCQSSYCLFNAQTGGYHAEYLQALDIAPEKMPPVLAPTAIVGRVTPQAAEATGLRAGSPVVTGTIDAWCDIIGCGGASPGEAVDVAGTSEVIALITDHPVGEEAIASPQAAGVFGAHLLENLYWVGGPMQGGGGTLLWWARGFYSEQPDLQQLAGEAFAMPLGADGLLFLPYLRGERAPVWDSLARGAFVGLTDHHTRAHCARAVYEGIAFAVRDILERSQVAASLRAQTLHVSGGASRSALWNQIKADITGLPVQQMAVSDAACLGAAMLAAVGVEAYSDLAAVAAAMVRPTTVFVPEPGAIARYNELFATWRALYPALRLLFPQLDRSR